MTTLLPRPLPIPTSAPGSVSSCPLCAPERPEAALVVEGGNHRYLRCRCGLVRLEQFPSADEMGALIQNEAYGYGGRLDWNRTYAPEELARLQPYVNAEAAHQRLTKLLARAGIDPTRSLRLHDIGCSEGFTQYFAQRAGWRPSGNDFSQTRREFGRRNLNVDFSLGQFSEIALDDLPLDVIVLRHVLEHLPDPLGELALMRKRLRPGGALLVEVPNFAAPTIAFKVFRQRRGLRKGGLGFIGAPEHLWQFTRDTLSRMLERAGFDIRVTTTTATATNHAAPVRILLEQTMHRSRLGPHLCVLAVRSDRSVPVALDQ
jgi:2-polyprenyl-3-methyl-5-hydroxy-6-metoxy-1,4-benzoquinol methylase